MDRQHDERGQRVKRRGILTVAGTVVAGVVAKQMSEPVAASQSFLLTTTETAGLSYVVCGPTTITSNNTYVSASPVLTLNATDGSAQVAVHGTFSAPIAPPSPTAIYGQGGAFVGVYGTANSTAVRGDIPAVPMANTIAVHGTNQATFGSSVGVLGAATSGIGGSFQGGTAPLRLIPGPLASTALSATGHQAGEVYVTSDHLLCFFDGTQWRQVQFAASTATITPTPTPTGPPGSDTNGATHGAAHRTTNAAARSDADIRTGLTESGSSGAVAGRDETEQAGGHARRTGAAEFRATIVLIALSLPMDDFAHLMPRALGTVAARGIKRQNEGAA